MSKYLKYPSYRDSGVEWLGEIPKDWNNTTLKFQLKNLDFRRIPISASERGDIQGRYPYYGASGIIDYVEDYIFNEKTILIGEDGANLLSKSTPLAFIADGKYWVNNHAHILKPKDDLYNFWSYILNSLDLTPVISGSAQPKLTAEALGNLSVVFPTSLHERQSIANYLDSATAKIDTLIEKQTKLIALLKEKRQAVISTAVTRGLDSTVAMKDSSFEWLGEIPEHWKLPQIARILLLMEQGKSPECDNNVAELDAWGVLKTSCVNNAIYNSEANKTLPSSIQPFTQYEVNEEDILMSRASGSINLIGSVAYVYKTRPKILLSDKIFRLYVDKSVNKIFFTYLMGSEYMRTNIKMAISGGEGMANNIAKSSITKFKMALPSVDEQHLIVKYIDDKTSKIDTLTSKATKAIELLKEKRTALISSAVTGKIDVREKN